VNGFAGLVILFTFFFHSGQLTGIDPVHVHGMAGRLKRFTAQQHLSPLLPYLFGYAGYFRVPVRSGYVPDVNAQDATGVLLHNLPVDLRVVLAAVADADKLQVGKCVQDAQDLVVFELLGIGVHFRLVEARTFIA
jgi:hypothetical protein